MMIEALEPTEFRAFFSDLSAHSYTTLEAACIQNPLFIVEKEHKKYYKSFFKGKRHPIFNYRFFNGKGNLEMPSISNWQVVKGGKGDFLDRKTDLLGLLSGNMSWTSCFEASISDPLGRIETALFISPDELINTLFKASGFESWKQLELALENNNLKKR